MTRKRRAGNNNAATTMDDIGSKTVVATEDTEQTEASPPTPSSSADNDKTMDITNANPVEDAMTVDENGSRNTDHGIVADNSVTMTINDTDGDGGNASNEASYDNIDHDGDDKIHKEVRDNADSIENVVPEVHVEEDVEAVDEEKEELWDLKVVLSTKQLRTAHPTLCQTDGCNLVACCIWSSNLDPETPWYSCLDCQEVHFGGWPSIEESEGGGGLPIKVLSDDLREAMIEKCTESEDPDMPSLPSSVVGEVKGKKASEKAPGSDDDFEPTRNEDDDYEEDDGEVLWELKKVFGVKELTKLKPTKCESDDCDLVACSVWKSSEGASWNTCLDCQENDYGGWPEVHELPIDLLTEENRRLIAEKCSEHDDPTLPILPTSMSLLSTIDTAGNKMGLSITPPPSHENAVAEGKSNVVIGAVHCKSKKTKGGVTPSPMPPSSKKPEGDKPKVMSKSAIEAHRKWQTEAERLGGPNARVVVSKPEAKKLIFDKLYNEFVPMNIDGVFKNLKAVIPSVVLKTCLDEMVDKHTQGDQFAEDSDDDDDDDGKSAKKRTTTTASTTDSGEFAGSLRLKEGRNVNNNLYYVDHTKLSNEGNGLLPEVRNELLCNAQKSKAELDHLNEQFKSITAEAAQLESEPKNEALVLELAEREKYLLELNDKLVESRAHASNEKHVKKVKSEIENMAAVWRKRKRQCIEFISMMEESTEGTISLKKCLKGEGALEIDSDEAAIKGATAFAQRKRPNVSRGSLSGGGKNGVENECLLPDDNFIGVTLSALGKPERVFLSDN